MQSNMSFANKTLKYNLFTVTLIIFFCFLSGTESLLTNTKTLEGMKTNLFSKLSNFPHSGKMFEIKDTISQLLELSKQDKFESYQRSSFATLINKTRLLIDDMLEEQRDEDIQFKNVTNLLMKYKITQEHALEIAQDKFQLMKYFVEFVESIDETEGKIDIKTDYGKLNSILQVVFAKLREYATMQDGFANHLEMLFKELDQNSEDLSNAIRKDQNPFMKDQMNQVLKSLNSYRISAQNVIIKNYIFNTDPHQESKMLENYLDYFRKQSKNETRTITPHFFPSFAKEEKEARQEILVLGGLLSKADEALKITTDSLQSNYKEYHANVKSRKDVVDVIYQMLELMNKRAKKIKGYQLKYIDVARTKFFDYENSYEFKSYEKYVFKGKTAEEIINTPLPKLPEDLNGIEDPKAQAPVLKEQVKLNVNKEEVNLKNETKTQ